MPHLLQHHPSGKLPQASKDRSFLQVQLWPSLDSLLAPSDSAKEAVECAGLGPRLCVFQATDKRKALEETMAFTTQALASVAYQVGNLAGHTLRMLDLQGAALRQVEAKMSTLGQMVNMHMEKVARREIGTLATVVRLPSNQKVIPPESLPSLTPYHRKPLNFACLDDIGHGVKDLSTQLSRTGTLSRKSIKAPATPVSATLGRPPRIPEPVQLPAVPDGKLSAASSASSLASAGAEGASGIPQSKGQVAPATPPPPPVAPVTPPPPPLSAEVFLPPPPLEVSQPPLEAELPLPPPPALEGDELGLLPPPPPGFGPDEPSWVPASYLEKVVTLYPYTRQKDNELSFSEGTVICVTRRYSDGWCEGVSSEGTGFFPGNYVEPSC
ncbi:ABI gene family member 3 isoform X3 [Mus musculus]|uniref:ABI gene family member 3 isoform X3 n=1 Tax=Mus musculus TaxID=10090 RepID=UPI0003D75041|nr:ABI gene family member 3 isoform X3 [Mus musculus]|eukprot:XP_017170198.1 PREDICTED: ABI gene family member 3 isoform X3 [Mus musculus]